MSLKSKLISDCKKIYWKLGRPEIRSGDKHPNYRLRLQKKYEFFFTNPSFGTYHSRALKSRSKLRAAIGLKAAFEKILLHQNSSLCTVDLWRKSPDFS